MKVVKPGPQLNVVAENPLDLFYLRVYSGVLKSSTRAFNSNTGDKENLSRMFRMFAKRREPDAAAGAVKQPAPGTCLE